EDEEDYDVKFVDGVVEENDVKLVV
ncbi:MAG: hypothetical protein EZS28_050839, partial [Streblomastix strix]